MGEMIAELTATQLDRYAKESGSNVVTNDLLNKALGGSLSSRALQSLGFDTSKMEPDKLADLQRSVMEAMVMDARAYYSKQRGTDVKQVTTQELVDFMKNREAPRENVNKLMMREVGDTIHAAQEGPLDQLERFLGTWFDWFATLGNQIYKLASFFVGREKGDDYTKFKQDQIVNAAEDLSSGDTWDKEVGWGYVNMPWQEDMKDRIAAAVKEYKEAPDAVKRAEAYNKIIDLTTGQGSSITGNNPIKDAFERILTQRGDLDAGLTPNQKRLKNNQTISEARKLSQEAEAEMFKKRKQQEETEMAERELRESYKGLSENDLQKIQALNDAWSWVKEQTVPGVPGVSEPIKVENLNLNIGSISDINSMVGFTMEAIKRLTFGRGS